MSLRFVTLSFALSFAAHAIENGTVYHYDLRGVLYEEVEFSNGRPDYNGSHRIYGPDGNLREVRHYENGLLSGLFEDYYKGGQLRLREYYAKGKREGESKRWHPDGHLLERHVYKNDESVESEMH